MKKTSDDLDRLLRMTPCDEFLDQAGPKLPSVERPLWAGLLNSVVGTLLILGGLYAILFWYGYSTMIDPSLPDKEWWAEWQARAFAGELLVALAFGISVIVSGCWLLIRCMKRTG